MKVNRVTKSNMKWFLLFNTDVDANHSINVQVAQENLNFLHIGFTTQEIELGDREQSREELIDSVSQISRDVITNRPVTIPEWLR